MDGDIPVVFDDSDGEVLISLSGDPMPLIPINRFFDNADVEDTKSSVIYNMHPEVCVFIRVGYNPYITPKTFCSVCMPVCSSSFLNCETSVINVDIFGILCESGKSGKAKSEYDGKLLHAANIAKNCDKDRYAEIKEKIRLMVGRNMPLLVIVKVESVRGETCTASAGGLILTDVRLRSVENGLSA